MQAKVLDNQAFFKELLQQIAQGREVKIRATGRSMTPLIRNGKDALFFRALDTNSIALGRIVLASFSGSYVAHRITKISGNTITLRGDGNPYQKEDIPREHILAELIAFERDGQIITRDHLRWKVYQHLWPRNGFLRRVLLYLYRKF